MRIAVFDSGLGGLTILQSLRARLPDGHYFYGMDNANFPYGPKSEAQVVEAVTGFLQRLLPTIRPDCLVIACNTASVAALKAVRGLYTIPVVGVVPAIKPAAAMTKTGVIGLLATPATIQSPYSSDLIKKYAPNCKVVRVGSARLAGIAEAKLRGRKPVAEEIARELAPFFAPAGSGEADAQSKDCVDVVVLGCTHFPLLRDEFRAVSPGMIDWIDSGAAVAERVATVLGINASESHESEAVTAIRDDDLFFSKPEAHSGSQEVFHPRDWGFGRFQLV